MIPIRLTIQGIYSYQKETTIDFNALTQAGIFGIFGAVGSGKSSILEAISYSLYGNIERLNSRENMAYNMMNLKSSKGFIEFEFSHKNKNYLFKYTSSRNKNNFENVTGQRAAYIQNSSGNWEALESVDATAILGLSYNHFKQIIIIPQGKFSEFVHLTPGGRNDLLKELFPLQQYDLSAKTNQVVSATKSNKDQIEGNLIAYEDKTNEAKSALVNQLKTLNSELSELTTNYNQVKAEFTRYQHLAEKAKDLQAAQIQLNQLELEQSEINALKEKLVKVQSAEKLAPFYTNATQAESKVKTAANRVETLKIQCNQLANAIEAKQLEIEKIEEKWGDAQQQKQWTDDFNKALELIQHKAFIASKHTELEALTQQFNSEEQQVKEAKTNLDRTNQQVDELQRKIILSQDLNALKNWLHALQLAQQNAQQIASAKEELTQKINRLKQTKESYLLACAKQYESAKNWIKLPVKQALEQLQESIDAENKELQKIEHEKNAMQHLEVLTHYAETLNHGDDCPLCGSIEHPKLFSSSENKSKLEALQTAYGSTREKINLLTTTKIQLESLVSQFSDFKTQGKQLAEQENSIATRLSELTTEKQTFKLQFNAEELQLEEQKQAELQTEIASLQAQIRTLTIQINNSNSQKIANEIAQLNQALSGKKEIIELYSKQLTTKILDYSELELNSQINELTAAKDSYKKISSALQNENEDFTNKTAQYNALKQQLQELETDWENHKKLWEDKFQASLFSTIQEFLEFNNLSESSEEIQHKIESFKIAFSRVQNTVTELVALLKEKEFSQEKYEQLQQLEAEQSELISLKNKTLATLNHQLNELTQQLEQKQLLENELQKVEARLANLSVLSSLFKGGKFMQFVSTIYLNQLCAIANVRFKKLTQNKLELLLDEKNNFIVRDYLNNGKTRLLKTLSGGQTFQAALCLALALSEQIQAQHQLKEQFFFMDEGFGSLDKDSLSIVFDSLKQLRNENRVVGVISHVDDLQQEIDYHLKVVNEPDNGSTIYANV